MKNQIPGMQAPGPTGVPFAIAGPNGCRSNAAQQRLAASQPHPRSPAAVDWMMRDRIARDAAFAGYLRRSDADGEFWMLVAALPSPQGGIRIGLRPTGALFPRISTLYTHLYEAESAGLDPAGSAALFAGLLEQAGFRDLDAFMAEALADEVAELAAGTSRDLPFRADHARAVGLLNQIAARQAQLLELFDSLTLVPTNMRILASRLEPTGGPVTAMSQSYQTSVSGLFDDLRRIGAEGRDGITGPLDAALFHSAFAMPVARALRTDPGLACGRILHAHFENEADDFMRTAARAVARLAGHCGRLHLRVIALDHIRILGQIESRRIGAGRRDLSIMTQALERRHADIRITLESLIRLVSRLPGGTTRHAATDVYTTDTIPG